MRCPRCGHEEDRVIDSRAIRDGLAIRRRRECAGCGMRFTTYEYIESASFLVVKRDGRREPYDRAKLIQGILKACEKRPIPLREVEELVDRVETACLRSGKNEIPSQEIGERVMEELRRLDGVAYVRFASVYRHFQDLEQFLDAIQGMLARRAPAGGTSSVAPGDASSAATGAQAQPRPAGGAESRGNLDDQGDEDREDRKEGQRRMGA